MKKENFFLQFIGFTFILLFAAGFIASWHTYNIEGVGISSCFAIAGIGIIAYAKKVNLCSFWQ